MKISPTIERPSGPPVQVTPLTVFTWLLDEGFYFAMPAGCAVMPDDLVAAYQEAIQWAMTKPHEDLRGLMEVIDKVYRPWTQAIAGALGVDPSLMNPFRAFVARKLGFRPESVRVYYHAVDGAAKVAII